MSQTKRALSTAIFSAKTSTLQHGFEPITWCLPGRRTTNWVTVIEIYKLLFPKCSDIVEIWQNLEKKRNTDYDLPPPYANKFAGTKNSEN